MTGQMPGSHGQALRFIPGPDLPEPEPGVLVIVLDAARTPTASGRTDVRGIRSLALEVLRDHDPLGDAMRLLDRWSADAGVADRMVVEGFSWWYRRRIVAWRGLHERLLWIRVLARLDAEAPIQSISLPEAPGAILDAVRLVGRIRGWSVIELPVASGSRVPVGPAPPTPGPPWPLGPILWRLGRHPSQRGPGAERRRAVAARGEAMRRRLEGLRGTHGRVLALTAPATHQTLGGPGAERSGDPFLGSVIDALAASGQDPVVLEVGADIADDATWRRLTAPAAARHVPLAVALRAMADPADDTTVEEAARQVAARLAEPLPALDVDGVDVSSWVAEELRAYAASGLASDLRSARRIGRLLEALRPSAVLTVNEYSYPDWTVAARRAGVPLVAVQHGIIHRHHAGYVLPGRDGLLLADRTYVFGAYEARLLTTESVYRPDEVAVAGAPRLDVVRDRMPGTDREAVRASIGARPGERLLVFSSTSSPFMRETTFAAALDTLLDGPWPGVHLVVKLHPAEADDGFYGRLVAGIAGARGFAPPRLTVVKQIDLFALLNAADAHLGVSSTVLTDAVAAGTRNLLATSLHDTDLLDYVAAGVAWPVRSAAELLLALDADEDPEVAAAARAAFLADHFAPGPSAPRIAADLMAGIASGGGHR